MLAWSLGVNRKGLSRSTEELAHSQTEWVRGYENWQCGCLVPEPRLAGPELPSQYLSTHFCRMDRFLPLRGLQRMIDDLLM
jgi:hypothetical protein